MKRVYRSQDELFDLNIDAFERIIALLKEWQFLSIKEYQYKLDCLIDSLLKIQFDRIPPSDERNEIVELITEEHFRLFGSHPRKDVLNKLGDFILLQYIKDRNKSKFEPNTFHTQKQIKRRMSKECNVDADTMDFLNSKMNLRLPSLYKKTKGAVE